MDQAVRTIHSRRGGADMANEKSIKTHELKIDITYYAVVASGSKSFEIRKNDRGFKTGDRVILKAYDRIEGEYLTAHPDLRFTIGYVTPYAQQENYVVFSLKREW